jgi:hypothetical protein
MGVLRYRLAGLLAREHKITIGGQHERVAGDLAAATVSLAVIGDNGADQGRELLERHLRHVPDARARLKRAGQMDSALY